MKNSSKFQSEIDEGQHSNISVPAFYNAEYYELLIHKTDLQSKKAYGILLLNQYVTQVILDPGVALITSISHDVATDQSHPHFSDYKGPELENGRFFIIDTFMHD